MAKAKTSFRCNGYLIEQDQDIPAEMLDFAKTRGYACEPENSELGLSSKKKQRLRTEPEANQPSGETTE